MAINDYYTQGQGYPLMGNERFQGENEIYQNMDQNMNYRGPDPFGSFNSGIGTFMAHLIFIREALIHLIEDLKKCNLMKQFKRQKKQDLILIF